MNKDKKFANKIALVTEGTSEIGKVIVKKLLANGCYVFVNFNHNEENMFLAKKEFKEISSNFKCIKASVSSETEVFVMMKKIKEKYGKLDFLVNNASTNIDNFIEQMDICEFKKVLNVNLVGKVICTKYAIELLKNSDSASVVNIASIQGNNSCIEAGVIKFTQSAALELSKYNIRVNSITPGFIITSLTLEELSKEEIKKQKENVPLKRLGTPDDIANTILFLLSDQSNYITGENINVNGGSVLK